jgi:tetratricopeptide (TPR) repeat protein
LSHFVFWGQINEKNQEQFDLAYFDAVNERIKGNFDKSNEYLEQCLAINDKNDAVYFKIAQNYYDQKKYEQALIYLDKAKQINSNNKWYQKLFIEIKIEQGADKKEVTKLIDAYKPIAKNKYIIGNLYKKLYRNNIRINYSKPAKNKKTNIVNNQWENLLKTGQYKELIQKGEEVLMNNPADAKTYLYMAKAKFALNKPTEAIDYLDMGMDFVQKNKKLRKQYYQCYINIYQKLKNENKANQYRQKLQKI